MLDQPTTWTVTLTSSQGSAAGLRALRAVLKVALRGFGLRCIAIQPVEEAGLDSARQSICENE